MSAEKIASCYEKIDKMYVAAEEYVQKWLQYQTLWDLEPSFMFQQLGEDLEEWSQTVVQVSQARSTFDTSTNEKKLEGITIDFTHVQSKVNTQYDRWQRDLLSRFGSLLGSHMKLLYDNIKDARHLLEESILSGSMEDIVSFIVNIKELQIKNVEWEERLARFHNGNKILYRQRYQYPTDWLYMDNVASEWQVYQESFGRKMNVLQGQYDTLKAKIKREGVDVDKRAADAIALWKERRPVRGDIASTVALATLKDLLVRLESVHHDYILVYKAHALLDVPHTSKDAISPAIEELADLRAVWIALDGVWANLEKIKAILWQSEASMAVDAHLNSLLQEMNVMPIHLRHYAAFEAAQDEITSFRKRHAEAVLLKSEALRKRHWEKLLAILCFESLSTLTVGQVIDSANLRDRRKQVEDVVAAAQGELALEEFINQVRSVWADCSLTLVMYKKKCKLVKGWDELFAKAEEHLASLAAMKNSAYYKTFKDSAASLEQDLTSVHALLTVWVKVQKQWVYLEGIFTGNVEIKQILAIESNRFLSVDAEFMTLLRKVSKSPSVLDVVMIPNIERTMNRLVDSLSSIQKSLGDYLEKERANFPRFYFVGDEDLLEILGSGKDLERMQPHLKKLFSGIQSLIVENGTLSAVISKEGERVMLKTPIIFDGTSRVFEQLASLERESKSTLAAILADAIADSRSSFYTHQVSIDSLKEWASSYPCQVVMLAAQCQWTAATELALPTKSHATLLNYIEACLNALAQLVVLDESVLERKKYEQLITVLVYQKDLLRELRDADITSTKDYSWQAEMRFYHDPKADVLDSVCVQVGDTSFKYGFEYHGVQDKLAQTPLTRRCYTSMAQALSRRLGGSPVGPAGTGKTETIKSMAQQLGRMCLVFCCDENFDFQAMGRIFLGLSHVGAWGCFDEFNRLEESILSAVSQQVQSIQMGLKNGSSVQLLGSTVTVNPDTGT